MTKTWIRIGLGLGLALGVCGCGEDAEETYCEILLPLAAISAPQGTEGLGEYCLECAVDDETYLVVNSYFEGIEAYPVENGSTDGCGSLVFQPAPTVPVGTYTFELGTYRVGDYDPTEYGDYGPTGAGALGAESATVTLTVTGEDCRNGIDDDGDDAADCDDLENCAPTPPCTGTGE